MNEKDKISIVIELLHDVLENNSFQPLVEIQEQCKKDWVEEVAEGEQETKECSYEWCLYGPDDETKEQYLVLIDIKNNGKEILEKIVEQQSKIYLQLKSKLRANFDKNVSMLICVKTDEVEKKEYEPLILEVEEDCYYFKKLIMLYRDQEISEVKEILENKQLSMWEYMQDKIQEITRVEEENLFFKELQKIVPRIYIKLPFIQLKIQTEEQRLELFEEIKKTIEEDAKKLSIWNQLDKMQEDKIKEFELKNDEKLDEVLKLWLPEEKKDEV